jgi:hypothetical protein
MKTGAGDAVAHIIKKFSGRAGIFKTYVLAFNEHIFWHIIELEACNGAKSWKECLILTVYPNCRTQSTGEVEVANVE